MPVERVVLLGFMGAGKSAVGAALARALGWSHVDLDREIERREGRSISEIFREPGEPYFRRLEEELTARFASRTGMVLSPGGGWITNPRLLPSMPPGTLSVWLRVSPGTALARVEAESSGVDRPLLRTADPAATVRRLLAEREPLYRRADATIPTDGRDVEDVAADIVELVRRRAAPHEEEDREHHAE